MDKKTQARTARESVVNEKGLLRCVFLDTAQVFLKKQIVANREELHRLRQELVLIEDASLHIHNTRGKIYFSCVPAGEKNERSINKEPERIQMLARRVYLEHQISEIEVRIRQYEKQMGTLDATGHELRKRKAISRLEEAGLDLCRIVFTKEQNEWIDQPYTPNPFHQGNLKYVTKGGIWMRSMAETKIGNALEDLGIPYRYDDLVTFGDSINREQEYDKPHRDSYFADFKIVNFCAGITVHEHLGAFQIEQYADNALWRLNDYRNFEIKELPGQVVRPSEITWSFEGDLLNQELFKTLLRRMLFPELV